MELTPLQPTARTQLPTLTQVARVVQPVTYGAVCNESVPIETRPAPSQNGSEQIPVAISDEAEAVGTSNCEVAAAEATADASAIQNGSETVPSFVADAPKETALVADAMAMNPDRSLHSPDTEQGAVPATVEVPTEVVTVPREPALRTVELYFVDRQGQRMTFDAATRYRDGKWRVDFMARAMLGVHPSEGRGLGGQPGRWHEFYPHKSPGECGFVENIGVLCWEDGERRAYAAEAGLLVAAFGVGWSERIRAFVAGIT